MGPKGCPETSVRNYHYSLRNNPEERSSNLLRGGSLELRMGFIPIYMDYCLFKHADVIYMDYCLFKHADVICGCNATSGRITRNDQVFYGSGCG
jgi:hypothetical protein